MTKKYKILNLYACLGGNRYKWDEVAKEKGIEIEVTAVEWDEELAKLYQDRFPNDIVIIADAHQYLLEHYKERFIKFMVGWKKRGYDKIPDEAPHDLEVKCWCPSWKRMARCILRNDFYCKGLGQTQPKSEAYEKYKSIKHKRKLEAEL